MEGNSKNDPEIPCFLRIEPEEFVFDGIMATSGQAIATKRTCISGLPVPDIRLIQGVVFAEACTVHAECAALIDVHSERTNRFDDIYNSPDRAVHSAVDHLFSSHREEYHYCNTCNSECDSGYRCSQ